MSKREKIIIDSEGIRAQLFEFCGRKGIEMVRSNGSVIDTVTLFLVHRPLAVIMSETGRSTEIFESLINAGQKPEFIILTAGRRSAENVGSPRGIRYVSKDDTHDIITSIREIQLEHVKSQALLDEEFSYYLDSFVYDVLAQLGFRFSTLGIKYVHDVIVMMCRGECDGSALAVKEIYPAVAKRYRTTPGAVERCIRHAISTCCKPEKLHRCLGAVSLPLTESGITPGNKELINCIANKVRYEVNIKLSRKRNEMSADI